MALYQLGLLGDVAPEMARAVQEAIEARVREFGLSLGRDVTLNVAPEKFFPDRRFAAAALYFGGKNPKDDEARALLRKSIAIVPVVSAANRFGAELPPSLQALNGQVGGCDAVDRLVSALLEAVGLIRWRRRVFVSYRRESSRNAALQLHDELSAHKFDVFLDTHAIRLGAAFQETLWHRLADSDAILMLDTGDYFDSIWTEREFGAACALNIGILRVGWPNISLQRAHEGLQSLALNPEDFDPSPGGSHLTPAALHRISCELERLRSKSIAVRHTNLASSVRRAAAQVNGICDGPGAHHSLHIRLANGHRIVAYPAVGVPNAETLYEVAQRECPPGADLALVYSSPGIARGWLEHLEWLGKHVRDVRWLQAEHAAFELGRW